MPRNRVSLTDEDATSLAVATVGLEKILKVQDVGGGAGTSDVNLTEVGGAAVTLGQKTSANSIPVVLPSDHTVPVSATNLDIRDLVFASDKVDASGSTLGANSGVDIGDVTINNASGASAVNIQDGGNSITVDATSLPLPTGAATEATLAAQSSFDHGSTSFGTSAVQITASSITAKKGVTVKAAIANTGRVFVGNSDVTADTTAATDGFELGNGESIFIEVDNANKVYVIGSALSQKVFWAVV